MGKGNCCRRGIHHSALAPTCASQVPTPAPTPARRAAPKARASTVKKAAGGAIGWGGFWSACNGRLAILARHVKAHAGPDAPSCLPPAAKKTPAKKTPAKAAVKKGPPAKKVGGEHSGRQCGNALCVSVSACALGAQGWSMHRPPPHTTTVAAPVARRSA